MADDVEDIGGISVSIGASHARLPGDIAAADQLFEQARARWQRPVILSAQAQVAQGTQPTRQQAAPPPARPVAPPSITYMGAAAPTPAFKGALTGRDRMIQAALDKEAAALGTTAGKWNAVTNEVDDANAAVRKHKEVIVDVQQAAAQPAALNIPTEALQGELQTILALLREIVATSAKLATMPAPKVASPGGKRPKGRAPVAGGDDEEEGTQYPRIQYVDQIERQRRQAARSAATTPIDVNRSEQALTRQRAREESATARERVRNEAAAARARDQNDRQASAASLQELTAQEQAAADSVDRSAAPPMTQARLAEMRRERAAGPTARAKTAEEEQRFEEKLRRDEARANRSRERYVPPKALSGEEERTARAFAQSARVRRYQIDEEQQARIVTSRRAAITGGGQTSRTLTSGLSALFGGTRGAQIEAQAAATQAARQLSSAEKVIAPLDDRLREVARAWQQTTGATRAHNRETFLAIRRSDEYRSALGGVRGAIEQDATAQERLNKLTSGSSIARNLFAITAGGAAFGIGLKAVDFLLEQAGKGFQEFFEIQTGFGATSTRVTTALGQQTLALHGNVDAALAAAEAQAGLSTSSSDALNTQLRLTTQIKAGALAQQQASELFRAGFGQGNAPTGLFGSFGGALGTGVFGQKGFTQQVQTDISAFSQGRGGQDILGDFSRGIDYLFNPDARQAIDRLSTQQGQQTPLQSLANFTQFLPGAGGVGTLANLSAQQAGQPQPFQQKALTQEGDAYLNNLNDAAQRGATALGDTAVASYRLATSQEEVDAATKAAAAAGDQFGVTLAQQAGIVIAFGDAVAGATGDVNKSYQRGAQQAAVGVGIADPAMLARESLLAEEQRQKVSRASLDTIQSRQEFALPGIIAGIFRQQQYSANVQQPAQFAMGALANPNLAVGTGITPEDQGKVAASLQAAKDLQADLNAEYAEGQRIIQETYRPAIVQNFGAAAATAFDQALSAVQTTGAAIAKVQAGISNEQAAYQAAQYNFQLQIAQRTLRDISGLTGANFGVESSRLGLLQRENLELSRQGQQLQFQMSQRQINFRVALAGFQAPGVTPEERQANVKAAEIEAKFAQDQLNIQRKMFGNQVKIVDIGNLRQGRDLMKQIGLLQMGRQVVLDTAAAEQKLIRLNQLQSRNVAKVGTFLSAVDNLATVAMGNIAELEAAAGKLMAGLAKKVLEQFGIYVEGLVDAINGAGGGSTQPGGVTVEGGKKYKHGTGGTAGGGNGGGGGGGGDTVPVGSFAVGTAVTPNGSSHVLTAGEIAWELSKGIDLNGNGKLGFARGGVFSTTGKTRITVGEAEDETVAILRNPRPYLDAEGGFGGGGVTNIVNFNGPIGVRSDSDIDAIARKVETVLGRRAAQKGLRGAY